MARGSAAAALALVALLGALQGALAKEGGSKGAASSTRPDIRLLEIRTDVRFRFARTEVFSRIANPANESQEVTFKAILPDAAFVSNFSITVGGRTFAARVEGREEARAQYAAAAREGRTAAHVQLSARRSNVLAVAVHVAARDKAAFNLTYEQLLARDGGRYRLRYMLDPGQPVRRLLVEARLRDAANLTLVRVASLRADSNDVDEQAPDQRDDPFATVEHVAPGEALVRWQPSKAAQRSLAEGNGAGLRGLLEVQYDVARDGSASELVVGDGGYFAHFFCPPEAQLPPLPKHVVFVLDVSGSMIGRKIEQLREAMSAILSELRESDTFSMMTYSHYNSLWTPSRNFQPIGTNEERPSEAVIPATAANIAGAKETVTHITANGGTHMFDALQLAFALACAGRGEGGRQALLFFLTDGEPNGPNSTHSELEALVARDAACAGSAAPLYSLAFGQGADFGFLKRLSLRAKGFARKIYEAADGALQLRNFYRTISSPLLANVTFHYADDQVNRSTLTQTQFAVHLAGAELVVAGRLQGEGAGVEGAGVEGAGAGAARISSPAHVERAAQAPFMERLWAYLTVRQLLERAHGDDTEARERARQLALRYAFVTSLTSLVVVKPDNTTANADPREAAATAAPAAPAYHSASARGRAALMIPLAGGGRPMNGRRFHQPVVRQPEAMDDFDMDEVEAETEEEEETSETRLASPAAVVPLEEAHKTRVPMSDIQWIGSGPAANGTHVFVVVDSQLSPFVVAAPTGAASVTPASAANCTASVAGRQQRGRCLPLPLCALRAFAADVARFLPFFCPLGGHAGVCCPEEVVRAITQAETQG